MAHQIPTANHLPMQWSAQQWASGPLSCHQLSVGTPGCREHVPLLAQEGPVSVRVGGGWGTTGARVPSGAHWPMFPSNTLDVHSQISPCTAWCLRKLMKNHEPRISCAISLSMQCTGDILLCLVNSVSLVRNVLCCVLVFCGCLCV